LTYEERRWIRSAYTAHRKLVQLAEDIRANRGEGELFNLASSAHREVLLLLNAIKSMDN
jgi:hypothetical protein